MGYQVFVYHAPRRDILTKQFANLVAELKQEGNSVQFANTVKKSNGLKGMQTD